MTEPSRLGDVSADPKRSEQIVAWVANIVGCLYCAWMGLYHWRNTAVFGEMYKGLGAELPVSTRLVVEARAWLYPAIFGTLVIGLLLKEYSVRDKRLSTMLTCLVVLVAQFLAQWLMTLYYLPLMDLIQKLS